MYLYSASLALIALNKNKCNKLAWESKQSESVYNLVTLMGTFYVFSRHRVIFIPQVIK